MRLLLKPGHRLGGNRRLLHQRLASPAMARAGDRHVARGEMRIVSAEARVAACSRTRPLHRSSAVRKRQPLGGLIGFGGSPVNGGSSSRACGSIARQGLSSACV